MSRISPKDSAIFTDFDDDSGLVINTDSKRYYELNQTGTFIWKCLDTGMPVDEVVDALLRTYEIGREDATTSVNRFMTELKQQDLVRSAQD